MNLYKIGKIVSIGKTYIIIESNYTGSIIYVARPKEFEKSKVRKVYIYEHKSEYTESIYGFNSFKERVFFENLLKVNGIGPKTAIGILKEGIQRPIQLIAQGDTTGLSQFPSIGLKTANQIVFQLKDLYKNIEIIKDGFINPHDIISPMKTLGFSQKQIDYAISHLKPTKNMEDLVESAIKLISNASFT
ncbi:Holliday junction branch migration protein RuvA [Candidatus Mycoplasma mahonii]|uniref:Holliday junction branch migration protein RuvA n=1 Tax=Candidatus Mycoplasma mahonii TaxID=3004105 RepID=UPI0026ED59E2|nr:Holliday junction branch migration protein RuvA [Candidatus Mycoplasma mahonii]WKX02800.1 Holliday junction branch migration protein RuvA [Candidatus Mycoplasma mahonii]